MSIGNHFNIINWRAIGCNGDLPDSEIEVLVYDAELDDTVPASLDGDNWYDVITGDVLPDPRYWAKKPFPDGV